MGHLLCHVVSVPLVRRLRRHRVVRGKSDISDNTASLFSDPLCGHDRTPIRTPQLANTHICIESKGEMNTQLSSRAALTGLHTLRV